VGEDDVTYQLLPPLSADDYEALKADIAERGVQVAVEYDEDGNIIDGHHRVRACEELGVTDWPRMVRAYADEAAKRTQARKLNLARRHMDQAAKRALIEAEVRDRPQASNRQVAADLGVDHKTVGSVKADLQATGEIPQLDKTVGRDGRSRTSTPQPKSIHLPGADGKRAVQASAVKTIQPVLTPAESAKLDELVVAEAAAKKNLALLPSPDAAVQLSKETGGWVKGSDGEMHLYVPPEQTKQYDVWLAMRPLVSGLAEPAHTAAEFAAAADDFWKPRFPALVREAIAYLNEVLQHMEQGNAAPLAAE
jgi:hypothetical protein